MHPSPQSEAVLGKALEALPRDQVIVATKVGRYGPDIADFDFSADRVTRSVRESLERLRMPYIDIIQCHDVEFGDLDQVARETIPALIKVRCWASFVSPELQSRATSMALSPNSRARPCCPVDRF